MTWKPGDDSLSYPYIRDDEPCPTLRLLAAPYRRHPEFQEAWL